MVSLGEGDSPRTASEDVAGSQQPTTPNHGRHETQLTIREEVVALGAFAAALDKMAPLGREAAIRWLVAKYADSAFGIFYR